MGKFSLGAVLHQYISVSLICILSKDIQRQKKNTVDKSIPAYQLSGYLNEYGTWTMMQQESVLLL